MQIELSMTQLMEKIQKREEARKKMIASQIEKGCNKCSQWNEYFGCDKCKSLSRK